MRGTTKIIEIATKEHNLDQEDKEVIIFGFNLLINSLMGFGAILIGAFFLRIFTPVLIATITAAVFRAFTGGAHANSPSRCIVYGAIIFNILGKLSIMLSRIIVNNVSFWSIFIITIIIAGISFYLYAPADTPGKPIATKVHRDRLRLLAFCFLLIWGVIVGVSFRGVTMDKNFALASLLGLIWQSISLWPITYRLFGHKSSKRGDN